MSRIVIAILAGCLLSGYGGLAWTVYRQRRGRIVHWLTDPATCLLRRRGLFSRLQPWLQGPQLALAALNGGTSRPEELLHWTAKAVGQSFLALLAGCALAALADASALAALGGLVALLVPWLKWKELRRKLQLRHREILLELPELLSRLTVMVGAGENVLRALQRCARRDGAETHPLYKELRAALDALERGESLAAALDEFGRRCALPEAKLLATTLLLNARRGGAMLTAALQELSRTLWEKRKAAARTAGEEASSRLAFPLSVIFLIIMVLVGAPALIMMSQT
jgi:tight adherence protein C